MLLLLVSKEWRHLRVRVVDPLLASFIDLEGGKAAETLRRAALDRRYGKRTPTSSSTPTRR